MYWAQKDYDKIQKLCPWINVIPKWVVLMLQLFVGGLIIPFLLPLKIQIWYLQLSNYKLLKENSAIEKEKSLGQFVVDIVEDEIWEAKSQFCENGKVEFITVVITNKKELLIFAIDDNAEKHMEVMMKLIKDECIKHQAVAVIQIGEGYEYKDENKIEYERKEVLIVSLEMKETKLEYFFGLDRSAKKILDVKKTHDSLPIFNDYLTEIYTKQSNGN